MKQRQLGNTPVKVTTFGLGCNNFGLRIDTDASRAVIHKAFDLGITFFDTADVYGHKGGSEICLGQFLGARRKDIVLASKFGNPMDDSGLMQGASRRYITQAVEASLKRLKTDWIDIYQLHRFDPTVPLEETLGAFDDLIKQGKIRYGGISAVAAWRLADMQWTARQHGYAPLTTCEVEYSLLAREPERELIPAMQAHGVSLLPYYPLASGFLTGKYRTEADLSKSARGPRVHKYLNARGLAVLDVLDTVAGRCGATLGQVALAWLMTRPGLAAPIASATSEAQLKELMGAVNVRLSHEDIADLDRASATDGQG